MVVDPFRDLEEARVAVDHHPPRVDSGSLTVREQRLKQFGDATTGRGGVHVQHARAAQFLGRARREIQESFAALGPNERYEPFRRHDAYRNLCDAHPARG